MSIVVPPNPFDPAVPFTKALRVQFDHRGGLAVATFKQGLNPKKPDEWTQTSVQTSTVRSGKLALSLGVAAKSMRGVLVITPDAWIKPWPGPSSETLGESAAYPFGQIEYPGGYDPAFFAVPVKAGWFKKQAGGGSTLHLEAAVFDEQGKIVIDRCHPTEWRLDRKLPILVASLWLEGNVTGIARFPRWPKTKQPLAVDL